MVNNFIIKTNILLDVLFTILNHILLKFLRNILNLQFLGYLKDLNSVHDSNIYCINTTIDYNLCLILIKAIRLAAIEVGEGEKGKGGGRRRGREERDTERGRSRGEVSRVYDAKRKAQEKRCE